MNLSFGEFRALVAKAFRGAGYSWGLTEDAAHASVRLAECGIDVGPAVVRLLQATEGAALASLMPTETWGCEGEVLCPICVGTSIADCGGCPDLALEGLVEPVFLAPFLVSVLETDSGEGFVIEWDGGRCEVSTGTIELAGSPISSGSTVNISRKEMPAKAVANRRNRIELDEATKTAIEAYAHRTYAPATEASRLAGAGAGLVDND